MFVMYRSNRSFNIPPGHTPGMWHLCCPGEEGIWLSESFRDGEFDPHAKGVGNLNRSHDFMRNLWALCTWRAIMARTRCATDADRGCILTDWQVNEVNIVVKCSLTDFVSLKWTFSDRESVKAFHNNVYLVYLPVWPVCKSAVCSLSHTACPNVCLLIRCRYDARQWNSHESHVWNVVISVCGIFL